MGATIPSLSLKPINPVCDWRIRTLHTKEPATLAWIDAMPAGSVLWDIGANIGLYSLYAAARGHEVVAVEPVPASFAALCESIGRNGFDEQITPVCMAVGNKFGVVRGGRNLAGWSGVNCDGLRAPVVTLDWVLQTTDIRPTHIKIDTDGHDLAVLQGGRTALALAHSVIVETDFRNAGHVDLIRCLMLASGFKFLARHVSPLTPQSPIGMDHWQKEN